MSPIGNVGSSGVQLYQYLSSGANPEADPLLDPASVTSPDPKTVPEATQAPASAGSLLSLLGDLRGQIETAVTSAIKNPGSSKSTSNLLQTIRTAAQQAFKANNIDPQLVLRLLKGNAGQAVGGLPGGNSPGAPGNPSLLDLLQGSGSNNSNSNSKSLLDYLASDSNGQSIASDPFLSLLGDGSHGSAPQNSTNGGLDLTPLFSKLFADFPNGTGVNAVA